MKCPNCRSENPQDGRFCATCGASLPRPAAQSVSAETQTSIPSLEAIPTGTMFAGRYQIIEEVGSGGMGKVFKVFDTKIQEKIALKIIRPEIAGREKTISRFQNELKLARQITHKNICRVHDLGEEQGVLFFTMEFVHGENLKRVIRLSGPLRAGAAADYARQICEGLAEAHRRGVIHRDLKPQNIMIDLSGTVKIMDFGIARSIDTKGWTGEGMIGTPEYMSPEQAEGKEADPRSDIYALGVILYEMTTGRLPFAGDTPLAVALKHKSELPPQPGDIKADIPAALSRVILKCMEKDAAKRYQNAEDTLADLQKIDQSPPPGKTPDGALRPGGQKPVFARSKFLSAAGIFLILSVILAGGYILLRPKSLKIPEKKSEIQAPAETAWKNSIAVLPFEDLSLEKNLAVFCEGMADDIRTKLSGIGELKVISKYSSDRFVNPIKDPVEIGKALKVAVILEGAVHIEKDLIRVNVKLTDAGNGFHLWSQPYEEKLEGNYFNVEDKISSDIAGKLNLQFGEGILQGLKKRETADLNAYICLHRGNDFERKYRDGRRDEDFQEAVRLYKEALKYDPKYCLATWSLGNAYESRYVRTDKKDDLEAMIRYYQDAYAINDSIAEVHLGMGWAYFHQGNLDQSYLSFKKALKIDPANAEVNFSAGSFLRSIGLYSRAIEHYMRAIELDPLSYPAYLNGSNCHCYIGEYDQAVGLTKQALGIEPASFRLHLNYARLLIMQKKYEEAEQEILLIEKKWPSTPEARRRLGCVLAARGEKEKALALIKDESRPYLYEITIIQSLLGMKEDVIRNVKRGIDEGFQAFKDYLYSYPYLVSNPFFDNLRDDPRFRKIVREEKIKYDANLKKYGDL